LVGQWRLMRRIQIGDDVVAMACSRRRPSSVRVARSLQSHERRLFASHPSPSPSPPLLSTHAGTSHAAPRSGVESAPTVVVVELCELFLRHGLDLAVPHSGAMCRQYLPSLTPIKSLANSP
jgi:hypothetical protein